MVLVWLGACGTELAPPPAPPADIAPEERAAKAEQAAALRSLEPVSATGRADLNQKGSLLFFPQIEVKWNALGEVRQDTFMEVSNDFPEGVSVQFYFVNGDPPTAQLCDATCPPNPDGTCAAGCLLERAHPGWNHVDLQFALTANQPTYWSTLTGLPAGAAPITVLDPGDPPGRPDPDPDNPGGRVLRGFAVGWAVNAEGREIRWNHLTGAALIIDYEQPSAWEYRAWAFQAHGAAHGQEPASCEVFNLDTGRCVSSQVAAGQIDLDGFEYDVPPGRLQFLFHTVGSSLYAPGLGLPNVQFDANLALAVCDVDLRQETAGPVTTKARYDVWNENEVRFSGTERCLTCWDLRPLRTYAPLGRPNHFLLSTIQTNIGHARVNGVRSNTCDVNGVVSTDAAILGVIHTVVRFPVDPTLVPMRVPIEKAGVTLSGQGEEVARILYDLIEPPEEAREP
jgi:hypothetical protein